MASFLEQRCGTFTIIDFAMENYAPGNQVGNDRFFKTRRFAFVATFLNPWIFIFCNNAGHSTSNCQNFKNLTATNRLQEAKRLDLCINFIKRGNTISVCTKLFFTWEIYLPLLRKKHGNFQKRLPLSH